MALALCLLLVVGGGAVVYYGFMGGGELRAAKKNIIGCWYGVGGGEAGYAQFLANGASDLVAPQDGLWLIADYRLIRREGEIILQTYDRELKSWEEGSAISFAGKDTLILTNIYSGERVPMERISKEAFEEVIRDQFDFITKIE